tara:strand:+ start:383 stop:796 length:414 start_codon:yes stop_codon:yes gene_type:complete
MSEEAVKQEAVKPANPKLDGLVEELSKLTVMEAAELSKILEEKWGVSASAAMAVAAPAEAPAEEKTEYAVILKSYPDNKKIPAIKIIRAECDLGLKEAKDFVEASPKEVKSGLSKEEAEELKKKIVEACEGAEVEIK